MNSYIIGAYIFFLLIGLSLVGLFYFVRWFVRTIRSTKKKASLGEIGDSPNI